MRVPNEREHYGFVDEPFSFSDDDVVDVVDVVDGDVDDEDDFRKWMIRRKRKKKRRI